MCCSVLSFSRVDAAQQVKDSLVFIKRELLLCANGVQKVLSGKPLTPDRPKQEETYGRRLGEERIVPFRTVKLDVHTLSNNLDVLLKS